MPKVLIITGDAAESLEVMYPYQRLLEEGYGVDIAAPAALVIPGGRAPEYIRNDPDVQRIVRQFMGRRPARRPALSRASGAGRGRDACRPPHRRLPGAGAGRDRGRSRVRRRRGHGGRTDGLRPSLAGPPGVDAGVHPHPASEGIGLSSWQ